MAHLENDSIKEENIDNVKYDNYKISAKSSILNFWLGSRLIRYISVSDT